MSDEVWDKILRDYIVPYQHVGTGVPTFIGHKDGEPLLNKRLPDRLLDLACAVPDMKIDIYSHGLMLPVWRDRGKDFMAFLATLPNRVRYMMSYHPRNHDGSENDYSRTIDYMRSVLRDPPHNVEFITVSHKSRWVTEEMQSTWRQNWIGLPITVHSNCSLNPWTGLIEEEGTVQFNGCPYADFGHWFFGVTGNVIACCLDLEEEIVLGNVMQNCARAMFEVTNDFYAKQRRAMSEKQAPPHAVCYNCFGLKRPDVPADLVPLGVRIA